VILTFPDSPFRLAQAFTPAGDQPEAIEKLVDGIRNGLSYQTLLGVTGSGKTFTMAHVIQSVNRPALVIAPNKTLAAQLYHEFQTLFPDNAVRYFVSYYDYYQPEAYVPSTDTFIEKDASINDEIDKMRHSATKALLERTDTIIVASVSCIYGLGSPTEYFDNLVFLERGVEADRDQVLRKLVDIQYERNDIDFHRGTFRVRGDVVEIFPAYEENRALRVEFFGDTVEAITEIDPLRGKAMRGLQRVAVYPASHYVTSEPRLEGQFVVEGRDRLLPDDRVDLTQEIQDGAGLVQLLEGRHQVRSLLVKHVVLLVQLVHPESPGEGIQCLLDQPDVDASAVSRRAGREADVVLVESLAVHQLLVMPEHGRQRR